MSRSLLLLAASVLALAACQPADEPTGSLEAETPPVAEDVIMTETIETVVTPAAVEPADDHQDEDHDAHAEHGDDDDHDDRAGGEAHVHGHAELAVSVEQNTLSISLEAPLDNFGLPESQTTVDDDTPYTDGIVTLIGGDCTRDGAGVALRSNGDHGSMTVDLTYTCTAGAMADAIDVTAFGNFAGFEEIDAVALTDSGQSAAALTRSSTRLDLQ